MINQKLASKQGGNFSIIQIPKARLASGITLAR
jgi:hypothetical protein